MVLLCSASIVLSPEPETWVLKSLSTGLRSHPSEKDDPEIIRCGDLAPFCTHLGLDEFPFMLLINFILLSRE